MKTEWTVLPRMAALVVAMLLIGGCVAQSEQVAAPTRPPAASASTTPTVVPADAPATAAPTTAPSPTFEPAASPKAAGQTAAVSCEATQPDQLGPFYVPGAPERSSVGQGHVLGGVVRSSAGCAPIAGAQIEFWLAGPNGQYDDDHRATLFADASGAYRFESNFPPPYSGRPSHIHVRVSADGYETLVTQFYPAAGQTASTFDLALVPVD